MKNSKKLVNSVLKLNIRFVDTFHPLNIITRINYDNPSVYLKRLS